MIHTHMQYTMKRSKKIGQTDTAVPVFPLVLIRAFTIILFFYHYYVHGSVFLSRLDEESYSQL